MTACVSQGCLETKHRVHGSRFPSVSICPPRDFKELARTVVGLPSPKSAGQDGRQETEGRIDITAPRLKAVCRQNSFWGRFHSFIAFDCLDGAHLNHGGGLLYSEPTDLKVEHILKNTFTATSSRVFD